MKDSTKDAPVKGSDWTRLLTDPDLVSNLGKLLQTYREVSPEKREHALLKAMREIKESAISARAAVATASGAPVAAPVKSSAFAHPEPITLTPPFEPDLFAAQTAQDRRRFARIKCFVAVELHIEGVDAPVWGNLSNVGRGGAFVETATPIPPGRSVGIGLWVANGKIWVKGVILTGIVTRSAPSFGVRVKFSVAELMEKEHLREFLKFIESAARKGHSENGYVAQLKR
jgi:PilZ domain-containing protein